MDAGSVGQNGVGGHGHNDMLSFEFFVQGQPLIVDPGCPTYTGDPSMRRLFRSTQWHNALVVDGKEMAEMTGPFRIDGSAKPHSVSFTQQEDGRYKLAAGHTGYHRLPDPVDVYREIVFDPTTGILACADKLTAKSAHKVERYLHFAPDVTLQERGGVVFVSIDQHRYQIEFDADAQPHVIQGRVSSGYGDVAEAPVLVLTNAINGDSSFIFRIEKV
jgi:uncharacterized heparinase superfamily protein